MSDSKVESLCGIKIGDKVEDEDEDKDVDKVEDEDEDKDKRTTKLLFGN